MFIICIIGTGIGIIGIIGIKGNKMSRQLKQIHLIGVKCSDKCIDVRSSEMY